MSMVLWQLRQWGRRLGVSGVIGLALLATAAIIQLGYVDRAQRNVVVQKQALAALAQAAVDTPVAQPAQAFNPLSSLPPTGTASQQIGALEKLAQSYGLDLPRGEYSVSPVAQTPLLRWQLVLPFTSTYPDLHAFLASALEQQPNLTLDELNLKRERIESDTLQVELRMSLFVEATP